MLFFAVCLLHDYGIVLGDDFRDEGWLIMSEEFPELHEELDEEKRAQLEEPPMYRVLLLNDDYTPMDFVVDLLMSVFRKTREQATEIMLHIHQQGKGLCGVYTHDVAETKVATVHSIAEESGHPLRSVMEKDNL